MLVSDFQKYKKENFIGICLNCVVTNSQIPTNTISSGMLYVNTTDQTSQANNSFLIVVYHQYPQFQIPQPPPLSSNQHYNHYDQYNTMIASANLQVNTADQMLNEG